MDITIGVISFNTKELLADCLSSVAAQGRDLLTKTVVVDNASTDGSVALVEEKYPQAQLIANNENLGFAKAANQVLKNSKSQFVLLLNSDTILYDKSIESMVDFMQGCPQAGAVGPLLLNPDGTNQASGRRFPSFLDASMHAFLGVIAPENRFSRRYKLLDWDRKNKKEVDWISGAAFALRRQAVKEIGFFDERFFMYVEDMDICYRLWENGWKIFLLPEAKVTHYIGESSKQLNAQMIREFQKSIYRFYLKQNAHSPKRFLAPLVRLGLFFRGSLLVGASKLKRS